MTAIIIPFPKRRRAEVRRKCDGWWVIDRDNGWKPITEAMARALKLAADIEGRSR
jgi:hypothetical protein